MSKILGVLFLFIMLYSHSQEGYFCNFNYLDSLFFSLDKTIANYDELLSKKELRIKKLKSVLDTSTCKNRFDLINKIILEYRNYQLDSTIVYINKSLKIADELDDAQIDIRSKFNAIYILGMSGSYTEALDFLKKLNPSAIKKSDITEYYTICHNFYGRMSDGSNINELKEKYRILSLQYKDSLIGSIPKNGIAYKALLEQENIKDNELSKALKLNSERLKYLDKNTLDYSLTAYFRAVNFDKQGRTEEAKIFFILSTITDLKNVNNNSSSLAGLSKILYEEGELDKASKYVHFAMDNAKVYNSKFRYQFLLSIFPIISKAYENEIKKQSRNLRIYGTLITALAFSLIFAFIFIFRQFLRLKNIRNDLKNINQDLKYLNDKLEISNLNLTQTVGKLNESNHVKEEYIANFLRICSDYINKLNHYRNEVRREIANKRIKQLFESTKSSDFIDNEIREFYVYFDNAFLNIYPSFVKDFNNLLIPKEVIKLKKDELLNTELRIFALIRLGITDSSKIAELLRYSVNTIYNYRAKVKNKAKQNRDQFEQMVQNIGSSKY